MHLNLGVAADILEIAAFLFITPEIINWNSLLRTLHSKVAGDPEGANAILIMTFFLLGFAALGGVLIWASTSIPVFESSKPVPQLAAAVPTVFIMRFLLQYLREEENRKKVTKWIALFGGFLFVVAKGLSILHFSLDAV